MRDCWGAVYAGYDVAPLADEIVVYADGGVLAWVDTSAPNAPPDVLSTLAPHTTSDWLRPVPWRPGCAGECVWLATCYGNCMHMQSTPPDAPLSGGVSAAWSKVAAFASAVDASLDKWLAENHRVGLTEFRALAFVSQASDKELRVNDLAQRVGLNQSSATRLVSRLEAKGLARRDLCEDDGRGVYAVITAQGEALLREVRGPYEGRVRELLGRASVHFPHLDVNQLRRALADVEGMIAL